MDTGWVIAGMTTLHCRLSRRKVWYMQLVHKLAQVKKAMYLHVPAMTKAERNSFSRFIGMSTWMRKSADVEGLGESVFGRSSRIEITCRVERALVGCTCHILLLRRSLSLWKYSFVLTFEQSWRQVLYENGFPVPQPIEQNRHQVVMEFIDAFPLYYSPPNNFFF